MKVVQLSTYQQEGGAAVAAARLHEAFLRHPGGLDASFLVGSAGKALPKMQALADSPWQKKMEWVRFVGERLAFLPYEKDTSVRFAFSPAAVGARLHQHPLVQEADVLHLHWVNFGFLSLASLQALFALGKPIVWTLHDMWAFTGGCHYSRACVRYQTHCSRCPYLRMPSAHDLSFRIFEKKKRLFEHANLTLVAPSRWLTQLARQAALTSRFRALTIPNTLDTELYSPKSKSEMRAALGLPLDKPLVFFASGNIQDPRKGFHYLREALERLSARQVKPEVVLAGKAPSQTHLLGLSAPVHYLGKISDPARLVEAYNAADLLVVPSLEDNLPNTVLEAMACGTPVVGFATGGIPEMIDHRHTGYLASIGSSEELADGIEWVLGQGGVSLGQTARLRVLERYAPGVVTKQYAELYTSLI